MIGTMNDQMRAMAQDAARRRRDHKPGVCLYFAQESRCASEVKPQCPHWQAGACVGEGDCTNFCHHYRIPPGIIREELVSV